MVRRGLLSREHHPLHALLPGYVYAHQGDFIYVNLFMSNTAEIELDDGQKVNLFSRRVIHGKEIKITVNPEQAGKLHSQS